MTMTSYPPDLDGEDRGAPAPIRRTTSRTPSSSSIPGGARSMSSPVLTALVVAPPAPNDSTINRKSTRLNSSHLGISYAVFCLKKKKKPKHKQDDKEKLLNKPAALERTITHEQEVITMRKQALATAKHVSNRSRLMTDVLNTAI